MTGRILIGGGTGFIGSHLARMLLSKGYNVSEISRSPGPKKVTWDDIYQRGLPENCLAVVNLAGQLLMDKWKRFDKQFQSDLRSSRIDTTQMLASAISNSSHPPKVWVSSSAVGYYPPHKTRQYDEDSPGGDAADFLSQLCKDWEAAAKLPANATTREVTVRIGLALARNGGVIKEMFIPFYMGAGGKLGSGQQWFPWIHAHDVAGIITHAIEHSQVTGVLNAVAPEVATNADFTRAFARALWRPAVVPVPAFAVKMAFGEERARLVLEGQKVMPKRTLESGYQYLYPDLASACKEFSTLVPNFEDFQIR